MSHVIFILLGVWLVVNLLVVPAIGLRVTRRPASRAIAAHAEARTPWPADAYVSILLSRLVVHAGRLVGAERTCLLVDAGTGDGAFITAAAHGMDEDVIGRRVAIDDVLDSPAARTGMTISGTTESGRIVVLCAWETSCVDLEPARDPLLGELAALCAAAVDDVDPRGRLERTLRTCAEGLRAIDRFTVTSSGPSTVDLISLATGVGGRLGLDRGALIELQLAACVYETAVASARSADWLDAEAHADDLAVRVDLGETADRLARLPGYEAVALIIRRLGEPWLGKGGAASPSGDRLPLASRILAACGAVWELTTHPSEGDGATIDQALRQVQGISGTDFDPTVVAALSHELMGDPSLAGEIEPAADWSSADALYSLAV